MSLIIETGAGLPDAESFATAAELADYAVKFGRTVPTDEPTQEALLRRAALQMSALPWKGCAVNRDQALPWPRYNVCRNGWDLPSDTIPPAVRFIWGEGGELAQLRSRSTPTTGECRTIASC